MGFLFAVVFLIAAILLIIILVAAYFWAMSGDGIEDRQSKMEDRK